MMEEHAKIQYLFCRNGCFKEGGLHAAMLEDCE